MFEDFHDTLKTAHIPTRKRLQKMGTLEIGVVETTPVVWKGSLYRFEWVRNRAWGEYHSKDRPLGCYHFVNMETGEATPDFAMDHAFGCCWAEGDTMYVHGVEGEGGGQVLHTFVSTDLVHWEMSTALTFPQDIALFNTSVCKGPDGYHMAIEIGGDNPVVGVPYTCIFARSEDLIHWQLLPTETCCYSRERYTACPVIRYAQGYYYIICLEIAPHHRCVPYIARTRDFADYELGVTNPVMWFDDEDKKLYDPGHFTPAQQQEIATAVNCNNSDLDLCEYRGKTVILYSWGNQYGREYLALAEYDGGMTEFLQSFFV